METQSGSSRDKVRDHTPTETNMKIDQKIVDRIYKYRSLTPNEIADKLKKLSKEWDIERAIEVNVATLALAGLALGTFSNRRWLFLPVVLTTFVLQHGIQRWSAPAALLRSLGFRTRQEIDEEIYAVKTLIGDFDNLSASSGPIEILSKFRK